MAIARTVDRRMFFLLDRAHMQLSQNAERVLAKGSKLGRAQAAVLIYLGYHDGCSLTELADGTGRKNAAISGLTDRMVAADLIERRKSYGDRRTRTVHLTDAGWRMREQVMEDFRDFNTKLVKGFSESEVETIMRFLVKSVENTNPKR